MLEGTERLSHVESTVPMQNISKPANTEHGLWSANSKSKLFLETTPSQRPDGLIEDNQLQRIFIIEITRTNNSPGAHADDEQLDMIPSFMRSE